MSPSEVYCLWFYLKDGVLALDQFSPRLEWDRAVRATTGVWYTNKIKEKQQVGIEFPNVRRLLFSVGGVSLQLNVGKNTAHTTILKIPGDQNSMNKNMNCQTEQNVHKKVHFGFRVPPPPPPPPPPHPHTHTRTLAHTNTPTHACTHTHTEFPHPLLLSLSLSCCPSLPAPPPPHFYTVSS